MTTKFGLPSDFKSAPIATREVTQARTLININKTVCTEISLIVCCRTRQVLRYLQSTASEPSTSQLCRGASPQGSTVRPEYDRGHRFLMPSVCHPKRRSRTSERSLSDISICPDARHRPESRSGLVPAPAAPTASRFEDDCRKDRSPEQSWLSVGNPMIAFG